MLHFLSCYHAHFYGRARETSRMLETIKGGMLNVIQSFINNENLNKVLFSCDEFRI